MGRGISFWLQPSSEGLPVKWYEVAAAFASMFFFSARLALVDEALFLRTRTYTRIMKLDKYI
jgi:hypothetical protein